MHSCAQSLGPLDEARVRAEGFVAFGRAAREPGTALRGLLALDALPHGHCEIVPARYELRDQTPYSAAYGDVYHSAGGGPAQARHVFLAGNALPERWAHKRRFVILETGFGVGLNFLATWRAWKEDPARCERLH